MFLFQFLFSFYFFLFCSFEKEFSEYEDLDSSDCTSSEEEEEFFKNYVNSEKKKDERNEFFAYLKEPTQKLTDRNSILEYWKLRQADFPKLSRMARDYLAAQISTASAERKFSVSGVHNVKKKEPPLLKKFRNFISVERLAK